MTFETMSVIRVAVNHVVLYIIIIFFDVLWGFVSFTIFLDLNIWQKCTI